MILESVDGYRWLVERPDHRLVLNDGEITVRRFLIEASGKSKVFVDVGAHVGEYSVRLAKYFDRVIAFEPNPVSRDTLIRNLELNGITNVEVLPYALADKTGRAVLVDKGGSSTLLNVEGKTTYEVEVRRLDDLITRVDVMKIDVEGYEGLVLKGALGLIRRCKPIIVIEHHEERGYEDIPLGKQAIRGMLSDYVALNIDEVHYAYIPRGEDLSKFPFALSCHWLNKCIKNIEEGKEWYHGLPETWWYGGNPTDFYVALKEHINREPVWINRVEFEGYTPPPLRLDGDWKWLIILDACRYDYFRMLCKKWRVEPRLSPASCTVQFLKWMFKTYDWWGEVAVVTGHPFLLQRRHEFGVVFDAGFSAKLNTTPPRYVTPTAQQVLPSLLRYKRRMLWFLQPHHPHIGHPRLPAGIYTDVEKKIMNPQQRVTAMFKRAKRDGILPLTYAANLRLVLDEVERFIAWLKVRGLKGKVVITSDHGEGLGEPYREGEKPVFSHPCGKEEYEVRVVPWVEAKL